MNNNRNLIKEEEVLKATSISDLKEYSNGQLVEFPPFAENQRFIVRLRRPNLAALAARGEIPNPLLPSATTLFEAGIEGSMDNKDALKNFNDITELYAHTAFIEPTYQELLDVGLDLTSEQAVFLFAYCQLGVKSLKNFR